MPAAKDTPKSSEIPRATPQPVFSRDSCSTSGQGPAWHNEEPRGITADGLLQQLPDPKGRQFCVLPEVAPSLVLHRYELAAMEHDENVKQRYHPPVGGIEACRT